MNTEWKLVKNVELHVGMGKKEVVLPSRNFDAPFLSLYKTMIKGNAFSLHFGRCVRVRARSYWNGTALFCYLLSLILYCWILNKLRTKFELDFRFHLRSVATVYCTLGTCTHILWALALVLSTACCRCCLLFLLCKITAALFGALRVFISCSTFSIELIQKYKHTNYMDIGTHK